MQVLVALDDRIRRSLWRGRGVDRFFDGCGDARDTCNKADEKCNKADERCNPWRCRAKSIFCCIC